MSMARTAQISRNRRGGSLLETLLLLVLVATVLIGVFQWIRYTSDTAEIGVVAERMSELSAAGRRYLSDHRDDLWERSKTSNHQNRIVVQIARARPMDPPHGAPTGGALPSLQGGGYLPESYVDQNPYGQSHVMVVRGVAPEAEAPDVPRLEAVIHSTGGRPIPDRFLGRIAQAIGADGGFVAEVPVSPAFSGRIVGTAGGWVADISQWQASGSAIRPGHVMASMALADDALVSDYLHRNRTGNAESNTMRTHLRLGGNDITGADDVAAFGSATIGRDANAGVDAVGTQVVIDGDTTAGRDATAGTDLNVSGSATSATTNVGNTARITGSLTVGRGDGHGTIEAPALSDSDQSSRIFDLSAISNPADLSAIGLDADAIVYGASLGEDSEQRTLGDWLRHDIQLVRTVGPSAWRNGPATTSTAYCPSSDPRGKPYVRVGCSGGRVAPGTTRIADTCSEQDCGVIGTIAIDNQGCQTSIRGANGVQPMAIAYCLSNVSGGGGDVSYPRDPGGALCPDWAPGTYPNCVYDAPGECPAWAPGTYPTCIVNACPPWAPGTYPNCQSRASCRTPWGQVVASGDSVTAWRDAQVPFGQTCVPENRTCINGTLTGSFVNQSCVVQPPANCTTPWGEHVPHGGSVTAWREGSVGYGNSCAQETRSCWNGRLSGSFTSRSCSVQPPANCVSPWGTTVPHGSGITAWRESQVPFNGSCVSQNRLCTNGSLSGSYQNRNCTRPQCAPNQGQQCTLAPTWWDTRPEDCSDPRHCTLFGAGDYGGRVLQCNRNARGTYDIQCQVFRDSTINCQGTCTPR